MWYGYIIYNFGHLIYFKQHDKYLYLQDNEDYGLDHVVMMVEATNCGFTKKE